MYKKQWIRGIYNHVFNWKTTANTNHDEYHLLGLDFSCNVSELSI